MQPLVTDIELIPLFRHKIMHQPDSLRLIVIRPDMHTLYTQTFLIRPKLYLGKILLFFRFCLSDRPVKIVLCHKVGQSDHGYKPKRLLMRIIDSLNTLLPPETLQRRNHIIKIPLDLMTALPAHLDRKGDRIQQPDRFLILAALDVGIACPADCDVVHCRHFNDTWFIFWHVKFLILFLVIKRHIFLLHVIYDTIVSTAPELLLNGFSSVSI